MTLDMFEVLVDAAVIILEKAAEAEYYAGLLFIACALGIGSIWALAIVTTGYSFGFLSKLFL